MAQLDDLYAALKKADAAGDTAGAQKLAAYIKTMPAQTAAPAAPEPSMLDGIKQGAGNLVAGAVRGAGSIGATILAPVDIASDFAAGRPLMQSNTERRSAMDGALQSMGAQPDSLLYQGGKLGGEIAGTAGAGGVLANGAARLGASAPVVNALASGGFNAGGMTGAGGLAVRTLGGAATGAASAGLVDPTQATTGGVIGAALPGVAKGVGVIGGAAGNALRKGIVGEVTPEVSALADRAAALGIQVPADRIANSKPLNALASSLNYVPLSGRQAVEKRMQDQLDTALSRTFGQDSPNVTMALRKAQTHLGGKFESTLRNNSVNVDQQFITELADAANKASRELGSDGASIIGKQVDDIIEKAATGQIDGQAAYNIKKTLDRIGQRNSPEAYYATDLRKALMGALDRSLGPTEAAAFKQTRQQYGNMLDLEKLAQNGAEGGVSIARLANMKNIGNKDMQELADIAAQFLKPREGAHGSAQRVGIGGATAAFAGLPALGGMMAGGRAANALLDSNAARNALLSKPNTQGLIDLADLNQLMYRTAPVAGSRIGQ